MIKKLLTNIRGGKIENEQIEVIKETIRKMETNHAISLVNDLFSHYADPRLHVVVKNNINKIAKTAWEKCDEHTKYEFGIKSGQYAAVGDNDRAKLSKDFLELVKGLSYLSEDQKTIAMRIILDDLNRVHNAYNNFYNEPPYVKQLIKYVSASGDVPSRIMKIHVETIVKCRIGNYWGVSNEAIPYYNSLIQLFQDDEIVHFLDFLINNDFLFNRGYSSEQLRHLQLVAKLIVENVVNATYKRALNIIINNKNWDTIKKELKKFWPKK